MKRYLSDQHQQNFNCDDDVDDAVAKRIKKRIKRNKFTLVNMGAETNVVCTLKKEAGYSEEAKEIGNSGNKVGRGTSYLVTGWASYQSLLLLLNEKTFAIVGKKCLRIKLYRKKSLARIIIH